MPRPKQMMIILLLIITLGSTSLNAATAEQTPTYTIDDHLIQSATEAGTYPVTLYYTTPSGEQVNETVYITVYFPRTITDETVQEGIDASDLEIEKNLYNKLSDTDLIHLTKAHAWSLLNGSTIPLQVQKRETIDAKLGLHKVTFTTINGTTITVNILEKDAIILTQTSNYLNLSTPEIINTHNVFEIIFLAFLLIPLVLLFNSYREIHKEALTVQKVLENENIGKNKK
jgi:hypothetical protein